MFVNIRKNICQGTKSYAKEPQNAPDQYIFSVTSLGEQHLTSNKGICEDFCLISSELAGFFVLMWLK